MAKQHKTTMKIFASMMLADICNRSTNTIEDKILNQKYRNLPSMKLKVYKHKRNKKRGY